MSSLFQESEVHELLDTNGQFAAVEFHDGENLEVEAVPSCWLINSECGGQECFWPTGTSAKVAKLVKEGGEPDLSWPKYPAVILKSVTVTVTEIIVFVPLMIS
jgi:hypothetical protein